MNIFPGIRPRIDGEPEPPAFQGFFSLGANVLSSVRRSVLLPMAVLSGFCFLQGADLPHKLTGVGIEEKLGARVDVTNRFLDENGKSVSFQEIVQSGKPTVLAIAYFNCPMLCGLVQNAMLKAIQESGMVAGQDFRAVTLSMDPKDTPAEAKKYAERYRGILNAASGSEAWAFLTGRPADVLAVTEPIGFRFRKDEETGEYLHAAGIFVLSPKGQVTRLFTGAQYRGFDLKMAIAEAKDNRARSTGEHFLLYCYQYNPAQEGYGFKARLLMRIGGGLMLLFLIVLFWKLTRRSNKTPRATP